eukprot:TRINITY_DN4011_c0_g1_i3.p1 TRINITY_DN4011_c0_g1~~TRINITY_DN4011_c0_g1_i3.p1  ORF type:complete len:849 (-),score=186.23 TRINITY_DN4011_c0_g1_i3:70-2616(-)
MSRPGLFASGGFHNLVINEKTDVLSWGGNDFGQVGDGLVEDRRSATIVYKGHAWAVGAGRWHSLLVTDAGEVYVWGKNEEGYLGTGHNRRQLTPKKIIDDGAVFADGGWHHSLVLTEKGEVFAWGCNEYGQLGDGTTEARRVPTKVIGGGIKAIGAGWHHSIALTDAGEVLHWGFTTSINTCHGAISTPTVVITGNIAAIACGGSHCLAIDDDSVLLAWGGNNHGQLGDGTVTRRMEPVEVIDQIIFVAAGDSHSVAVTDDFRLFMWGFALSGPPSGGGTWQIDYFPWEINLEGGVHSVSAGATHTLALNHNGEIYGWGNNASGQIGDNTIQERCYPRMVLCSGTVEVIPRKDAVEALLKGPGDVDVVDQSVPPPRNRPATFTHAMPGKLPPRLAEDNLRMSEEHESLWGREAHPLGPVPEILFETVKQPWTTPADAEGLVFPGRPRPEDAHRTQTAGEPEFPELLQRMEAGESEFARRKRERAERRREEMAKREAEAAVRKQLERVRRAIIENPRIGNLSIVPPDRVSKLPPYASEDMMMMLKSCIYDIVSTSLAMPAKESKWIKDPALLSLIRDVFKPIIVVNGMMITHWPKRYIVGGDTQPVSESPMRLTVLGEDSDNWAVNELEDLRYLSVYGCSQAITSCPEWLLSFFGTKGDLSTFPQPYGPSPPEDTPPPTSRGGEEKETPFPKILDGISMLGLGGDGAAYEEVDDADLEVYTVVARHPDKYLPNEALRIKYLNPELFPKEGYYDFKKRIIEGRRLMLDQGAPPTEEFMEELLEGAKNQLKLRKVLAEAEEAARQIREAKKAEENALPEGWTKEWDPEYDEWYYWHAETKVSVWDKPTVEE